MGHVGKERGFSPHRGLRLFPGRHQSGGIRGDAEKPEILVLIVQVVDPVIENRRSLRRIDVQGLRTGLYVGQTVPRKKFRHFLPHFLGILKELFPGTIYQGAPGVKSERFNQRARNILNSSVRIDDRNDISRGIHEGFEYGLGFDFIGYVKKGQNVSEGPGSGTDYAQVGLLPANSAL